MSKGRIERDITRIAINEADQFILLLIGMLPEYLSSNWSVLDETDITEFRRVAFQTPKDFSKFSLKDSHVLTDVLSTFARRTVTCLEERYPRNNKAPPS